MLNTEVACNLDTIKLASLHGKAWNQVQALVSSEREQAFQQYRQAVQVGSASNHLGDIITKAINGKVEKLFIASSYQKWGRFNPYTWEVEVHWQPQLGDMNLTQFAVEQTLLHGGSVYVVCPEMHYPSSSAGHSLTGSSPVGKSLTPDKDAFSPIAAILRS
ncbi:hypothetical protein [Leptolyngbya ohadii]|uniref:hypothetical protein n=1 Tax=Leptolyngbya ohadii TaxID=1962290 RepID=UPI000B59ED29|nr:hypothetical protein [Leptolyngbya ohadii]